ncbi:MAG: PQQ-dependent sugar dehydrogenase, partial [Myxococcota bacterium]
MRARLTLAASAAIVGCGGGGGEQARGESVDAGPAEACKPAEGTPELALALVADGLSFPTDVQSPPGDARIFVAEQKGLIRIIDSGTLRETPFLDLRARMKATPESYDERGLLGLAFHPDFAKNRRFFVNYTGQESCNGAGGCDTHIAEFRVSVGDPNLADAASERELLTQDQPYFNHNGGGLAFGPDGALYVALGDGGSAFDPEGNGQNRGVLLGKILRLDVDGGEPYGVPADNPFVGEDGAREEIWAYGLRNPWRISFDSETGDLYVADVGQYDVEEIDVQPASSAGGENYGWSVWEG